MSLQEIQNQENENLRQSVLLNLNKYSESLVSNSSSARNFIQNRNAASKDLNNLERGNVKFVNPSAMQITGYYSMVAALVAIYGLDVLLFGSVATKFAEKAFPDNEIMLYVIKFVTPLLILLLEFLLALKINQSQEPTTKLSLQKRNLNLWTLLGIVLTLVMPLFIVSSDPDTVTVLNSDDSLSTLLTIRICGLLIVALLAHSIVIFSGSFSAHTKAFLFFRHQQRKLSNLIQSLDEIIENFRLSVINTYNAFSLEQRTYNQQFPNNQIPQFEFDFATEQFIRESFTGDTNTESRESENTPQVESAHNFQPVNTKHDSDFENLGNLEVTTSQPNQNDYKSEVDSAEGENEYLRSVLTRNIKDADDEVN